MLAVLLAVRDWLVAMALAWVGVTVDTVREQQETPSCASAPCED